MANLILTLLDWQERIRNKLGVDEAILPNTVLEKPEVIGIAEAEIVDLVPGYAELTGNKRVQLEAATVCGCAAQVCLTLKALLPTREQGPHYMRELAVDWDKRYEELLQERERYLADLISFTPEPRFGATGVVP